MKNGRPRWECKLCRLSRSVRAEDEQKRGRVRDLTRELATLARRGRLASPRTQEVFAELVALFDGHAPSAAKAWKDLADSFAPGSKQRAIFIRTLMELLLAAQRGDLQATPAASQAADEDLPKQTQTLRGRIRRSVDPQEHGE